MSTETREKAVRALVAAIDETMAEVRQGPFSTPSPGQRTKLADLSPSAALLLEGVAPGVSRVVVRLSAPYVAHVEVPVEAPADAITPSSLKDAIEAAGVGGAVLVPGGIALAEKSPEAVPVVPAAPSKRGKRGA